MIYMSKSFSPGRLGLGGWGLDCFYSMPFNKIYISTKKIDQLEYFVNYANFVDNGCVLVSYCSPSQHTVVCLHVQCF